jgi:hypothetical protein
MDSNEEMKYAIMCPTRFESTAEGNLQLFCVALVGRSGRERRDGDRGRTGDAISSSRILPSLLGMCVICSSIPRLQLFSELMCDIIAKRMPLPKVHLCDFSHHFLVYAALLVESYGLGKSY